MNDRMTNDWYCDNNRVTVSIKLLKLIGGTQRKHS